MEWFVNAFIKASVTWLGAGVTLGVAMTVNPTLIVYRPAHVHMNLLGFVTMMIYGVAYHVIPRFTGHQLHSRRIACLQWWLANIGLALMVFGFCLAPNNISSAPFILAGGGIMAAMSAYLFVYNVWLTVDGVKPKPSRDSTHGIIR